MRLKDRVAMVSGMAMGIGEAIAERFAGEESAIVGVDINEKGGRATAERINSKGGRCLFRVTDVASEDEIKAAVEDGIHEFGKIDTLVNVVGIASEAPVHEMELADWEKIIRVNLTSMFLTSKYVLPGMLEAKRGSIIHITSVQGILGFPGYPHYAASKGGIISMTRQMSREYAGRGIRVNCIAPGTVETPLNVAVLSRAPDPQALRASWERMHPMGRIGLPIDIANGALYLASDEASWVTGQCLVIDGGASTSAPA
ncbi:MAG TPA: SDR family NAD(P)-dependent oxidoreductase [Terriglobia bacterium]|nr:SDR family NAD(P)-dependent oxidoreductase [Terriglobia bacterium]